MVFLLKNLKVPIRWYKKIKIKNREFIRWLGFYYIWWMMGKKIYILRKYKEWVDVSGARKKSEVKLKWGKKDDVLLRWIAKKKVIEEGI